MVWLTCQCCPAPAAPPCRSGRHECCAVTSGGDRSSPGRDAWPHDRRRGRTLEGLGPLPRGNVPTLDYVYDAAAYDRFRIAECRRATLHLERPAPSAPARHTNGALAGVRLFDSALPRRGFNALRRAFPESHFQRLLQEGFRFYQTTFWYPLDRGPVRRAPHGANDAVVQVAGEGGVPVCSRAHETHVLRLLRVRPPVGEHLIGHHQFAVGQRGEKQHARRFRVPDFRQIPFVEIVADAKLRIAMAVNWWTRRPEAGYLGDSRECMTALQLKA